MLKPHRFFDTGKKKTAVKKDLTETISVKSMLELLLPYIESKPIMREPVIAGDLRIYDASDYQKLVKMQNETMLTHISPISSCFFSQWPFPYTFSNLAVAIKRPTKKNLARLAMCAVSGKLMDKPTIAILSCRFSKH